MNNLKVLRELRGLKQAALARELHVKNQASISEWETGRKGLSIENAIMFAEYFNVTVGCIVGTEPVPEGYPDSYTMPARVADLKRPKLREEEEEKAPFSKAQIDYLNTMKDQIVEEVVEALKEDTSSSSGA